MISSLLASSRRSLFSNPALAHKVLPGSFLAACVAAAFLLFFQFTKHDATISAIMPFGNDPYDAVGSFGVVIGALLSLLSIVRAMQVSTRRRQVIAARTQAAVAAAVLVTIGTDVVAMGRHIDMWFRRPAAPELLALMVAMVALALLLWFASSRSVGEVAASPRLWRRAAIVCTIAVVVLAVYPESLTANTVGALFTILIGIVLLFIPMSALVEILVPWDGDGVSQGSDEGHVPRVRPMLQWVAVALLGIGVGVALLIGEWTGGDVPVPAMRVMLASVYVGGALVGLSIAYYALRKPLALFRY